ncbi:uncharacterized protein AB9X84_001697 isoform 1-T1 [Acanthopagrus schlegelii]
MFQGPRHDQTFSVIGFHDWKHAMKNGKGLNKHAASKEHLTCEAMWRDKQRRIHTSKEISTLINTDQLQRNRYYLSAIIDVVEFLAVNQLPFRGLQLVCSACTCLENIRTQTEFQAILAHCDSVTKRPSKRKRSQNTAFADYVVEDISTHVDTNEETELRRIFYSCIDSVCGEMKDRFGKNNCQLMEALKALDPVQGTFLDVSKVKPLLDLTKTPALDSEFEVACNFLRAQMEESSPPDGEKWTMKQILKQFHRPLEAMPTVLTAFKHGLTFGASTASCENSFSTLKNVFTEHRQSMLHQRKANLIHLAFEKDLTRKFRDEWKDMVLRRFHTIHRRRLPLY